MFAALFQAKPSADDSQTASGKGVPGNSLLELAYSFSPLIEETSPNTLVMDITGLAWRFVSYRAIANSIAERAIAAGLAIHLAVAGDPDTAIHLARSQSGVACVPPGDELKHLRPLPLRLIDPSLVNVADEAAMEILETLSLWGIQTFGDFAALPAKGVAERLGQAGIKLQGLAKGTNQRHLVARNLKPEFEYAIELEHHLRELEPLSFILSRQLHQLCASLEAQALATNQIRLGLTLNGKKETERTINLASPMRDPKTLLKLLLLHIETDPPAAPVSAVSIGCTPVIPRTVQSGLFQPLAPQPDKLEITLARIRNLVGANNLGLAEPLNTHRPDAFNTKPFTVNVGHRRARERTAKGAAPLLGFRRFRPLLIAEVQLVNGRPTHVKTHHTTIKINGAVARLAGPWRTTGDWWRHDQWARDEWDVLLTDAADKATLCRIFQELKSGKWYVEGVYD
jgi:protein ImuB